MDLYQQKLSKLEWESIEVPVDENERNILNFIKSSYSNVNTKYNMSMSILNCLKIVNSDIIHSFLYDKYFKKLVDNLIETYKLSYKDNHKKKKDKPKKIDIMRIENFDRNVNYSLFEFVLIELCEKFLLNYYNNKSEYTYYYYTINKLKKVSITNINNFILKFVNWILTEYEELVNI